MSSKSKKKIGFSPIGTVTKTVEVGEEFEPFDITFELPSPGRLRRTFASLPDGVMESYTRMETVLSDADGKTPEEIEGKLGEVSTKDNLNFEEVALAVCSLCVKSWTLDEECTAENMERINPQAIVTAMFVIILAEIAARKN